MEAYEYGMITENDVGCKLGWGCQRHVEARQGNRPLREGFGDLLGRGVERASKQIGQGSQRFAVHVKGLEPAMHDPRACASMGLVYATNPNGATHWPACNVIELKKVNNEPAWCNFRTGERLIFARRVSPSS